MFIYQKKLQYPVRIKNPNPALAAQIISQYGGPHCKRVQSGGNEIGAEARALHTGPILGDEEGLYALQAFHQVQPLFLA